MILSKDGQTISLDNESHVDAFLASGWAEVKSSAPVAIPEAEAEAPAEEIVAETKEEKKPAAKKRREK